MWLNQKAILTLEILLQSRSSDPNSNYQEIILNVSLTCHGINSYCSCSTVYSTYLLAEPCIIELTISLLVQSCYICWLSAYFVYMRLHNRDTQNHGVQWKAAMLTVIQAAVVFIGDLLVSPVENYCQLQLNYQTTYQQLYMEHITIYNSGVLIFDTVHASACCSLLMGGS